MHDVRRAFAEAVTATTPLFAHPELAARWDERSALDHFSVRGLAGHLLRGATSVDAYLDRPRPPAGTATISAATYYTDALADSDLTGDMHVAIRARGEEAAAAGAAVLAAEWDAAAERLPSRLAAEPPDRLVRVFRDHVLTLDAYLCTRLIEICVHVDDLATSLGVAPPPLPEAAGGFAVTTLVEVARLRHGDIAVLRALARRERDGVEALHVI